MPSFGEILGQEPEEPRGGSFASILSGGVAPPPQYIEPPEEGYRLKALGLALANPFVQLGGLLATTPGELIGRPAPPEEELDPLTRFIRPLKGIAERTQAALTEEQARLLTDPQTLDMGLDDDIDRLFAYATLPAEVAGDIFAGGAIGKGLKVVRGTGQLAADPLRFGKTFGEAIGKASEPVRGTAARWLTSTGGKSKEVRAALERRTQGINATTASITEEANALRRMIDDHLAENPQMDRKGFLEQVNSVLDGSDPGTGVVMPDKIRNLARAMRDEVDRLSQTMVDEGVVDEQLADTFRANMGHYITRAYRAFEDPKHIQKLRKTGDWDKIKSDLRASSQEYQLMDDAELDQLMEHWASRSPTEFWREHEGIFRMREDLPKPLRELMGEYTDPGTRYFKTVHRMARNIEQQRMYQAMRELGLKEGWLSTRRAPGFTRQVGEEGTSLARSPVGGLYTDEEMLSVLEGVHVSKWPSTLRQIAGWAKWGKTVGSIQAQARNIEANPLLLTAGGNLGTKFMPWGRTGSELGMVSSLRNQQQESGKRIIGLLDELGEDVSIEKIRGLSDQATRLGVFGQQVDMGDIERWLSSSRQAERGLRGEQTGSFLTRAARKTGRGLERLYRAGDEVFKFAAWRSEMAKLRWAYPNKTADEIAAEAADIVKDTMPTYSRVPRLVEFIRRYPVGNFVSFVSEIPRNTANNLRVGLRWIREGAQTGNKRLMTLGAHRLASLSSAYATPWVASAGIRAARDAGGAENVPTGVQEEWSRHLAPPWMRHGNNLLWQVTPKGDMVMVDLSFSDPFAQVNDSIRSAIQAGKVDDDFEDRLAAKLKASVSSLMEPYATTGVVGGAAIPAITGRTVQGRELHPEGATALTQALRRGGHVFREMQPGTLTSLTRLRKAWANEAEPWGRTYDLSAEASALLGPRPYSFKISDSLEIRAREFARNTRDASFEEGVLDRVKVEGKNLPAHEKWLRRREAASLRERSFQDLALAARAASELGMSRGAIFRSLDSVLSKDDARVIMRAMDRVDDPERLADLSDLFAEMEKRQAIARRRKEAFRSRTGR